MKKTLTIATLILMAFRMEAQLEADNIKYQWQRTAYERWDNFKPGSLFNDFKILGIKIWGAPLGDYKEHDRRTMYAHAGNMALWSMYADHYDMYQRSTDSIFRQETYKALDRTMNKNYLLLQKSRVETLYDRIDENLQVARDGGIPPALLDIFEDSRNNLAANIDFIKEQYVPDADKYPLIEQEIEALEELFGMTGNLTDMAILLGFDETTEPAEFDLSQPLEGAKTTINSLIRE